LIQALVAYLFLRARIGLIGTAPKGEGLTLRVLVAAVAAAVAAVAAPAHAPGGNTVGLPHASPSVRKFARELGVPLDEVKGSGLKGRITEADVQNSGVNRIHGHRACHQGWE
jgi:pyruvate/2-oxoglutarate dehydrogenase complex dihydrolipoamide acyltransferase (E2) component